MTETRRKIFGHCPYLNSEYYIEGTYPDRPGWHRAITLYCKYQADNLCKVAVCPLMEVADHQKI